MYEEHIRNLENELAEYKKSQKNDLIKVKNDLINQKNDPIKFQNDPINLKKSAQKVLDAIKADGSLSYQEYAKILNVSEATVKRNISLLKSDGFIAREGSNKNGHWIVL
jgi:predicted HTH transcriptional regulator